MHLIHKTSKNKPSISTYDSLRLYRCSKGSSKGISCDEIFINLLLTMRFYPVALQTILLSPLSTRAFITTSTTVEVVSALSLFGNKLPLSLNRRGINHRPNIINSVQQISYCRMASTSSSQDTTKKNLVVDPFCFRQFAEKENSKGYAGAVLYVHILCVHIHFHIFVIILLLFMYISTLILSRYYNILCFFIYHKQQYFH